MLCCDKVGVYTEDNPILVKDQVHIMTRTAQISNQKQSIITLRQEGQSGTFQELFKFNQVQLQKSSAMMKLALMRTATGKEDPKLALLQRIFS